MYKPAPTSNPTVRALEAFSTALGIIICAKKTSHIQGTAVTVSSMPKLFLAVKHVLFCVDENEHYEYNSFGPRRNICYWVRTA